MKNKKLYLLLCTITGRTLEHLICEVDENDRFPYFTIMSKARELYGDKVPGDDETYQDIEYQLDCMVLTHKGMYIPCGDVQHMIIDI